jgi:hypothetical protein
MQAMQVSHRMSMKDPVAVDGHKISTLQGFVLLKKNNTTTVHINNNNQAF